MDEVVNKDSLTLLHQIILTDDNDQEKIKTKRLEARKRVLFQVTFYQTVGVHNIIELFRVKFLWVFEISYDSMFGIRN